MVYAALDPRLGRSVALKLLPDELMRDERRRGRFQREAQLLARVHHPNVATIFTLEEDEGRSFLTMELVSGDSLSRVLEGGPLALDLALPLLRQVASGVEAAHAEGVVHRDLKPGNILVDSSGRAKVLDFGIATTLQPSPGEVTQGLTQDVAIGTPGYMSPEQLRGDTVDERSDIWSFAAVAAEVLAGQPIIWGESAADRVAATLLREPDFGLLPKAVPAAFRTLLASCLSRSPAERPASMSVVRRSIEELLAVRAERERPRPDHAPPTTLTESPSGGNLPAPLSSFVGRVDELGWIEERLSTHSLVTLVGVGGGGKTRLAIESARAVRDRFPGGAWLVELAPVRDPAVVPTVVARVLDIPEELGQPQTTVIAERLKETEVLLVLDNCEHVIDAAAELARELLQAAGGVRILATSREALGLQGEAIVPVAPLQLPLAETMEARLESPAVALLLSRVRQHHPGFEETPETVEAAVRICTRLDGLPLALELAAARTNVLSLSAIEERLNDRFRLLRRGAREASAHHQTLDALIAWSYDLLEPAEQRFFCRLSVFSGGCTLEAAEFVCADEEVRGWDVLDFLGRLAETSLVETRMARGSLEEVRYVYLESIREFARARLAGTGAAEVGAVERRHAEWVGNLARQASDHFEARSEAEWLERLETEHFNIRSALSYCLRARQLGLALEIAGRLVRYWEVRGHWIEGLDYCTELLEQARALPPSTDLARVFNGAGNLANAADRYDFAEDAYNRALEAWTELGSERGMAGALNNLCLVSQRRRDLERAKEYGERALAINRRIGNRAWEATNLLNLGLISEAQGHHQTARDQYEAALAISTETGDRWVAAACLANLGIVADSAGDLDAAADYYERSLEVRRDLGDRRGVSISLGNLGVLETRRENFGNARRLLAESLRMKVEGGYVLGQVYSVESFASLESAEDRFERAARLLGAAEAARASLGSPLSASELEERAPSLRRVDEALGETRRNELMGEGRRGGLDAAVRSILAESDDGADRA